MPEVTKKQRENIQLGKEKKNKLSIVYIGFLFFQFKRSLGHTRDCICTQAVKYICNCSKYFTSKMKIEIGYVPNTEN